MRDNSNIREKELFKSAGNAMSLASKMMAIAYLVLAMSHPLILPDSFAREMTVIAFLSFLICSIVFIRLGNRKTTTLVGVFKIQALLLVVVCVNVFVHLYLSQEAIHSTNLLLIFFVMAMLVFDRKIFFSCLVVIIAIWLVIFLSLPRSEAQTTHFIFSIVIAAFLSGMVFLGRARDFEERVEELVYRQKAEEELRQLNSSLERLSNLDPLTEVGNRRYFEKTYQRLVERNARDSILTTFIICDLDNFKKFNDSHGHEAGDRALKEVAQVLTSSVRSTQDFVARLGGEEFVLLCSGMDNSTASRLAEDILSNVRKIKVDEQGLTVSLGIYSFEPEVDMDPNLPYQEADRALYQAKVLGKDKFVSSDQSTHREDA